MSPFNFARDARYALRMLVRAPGFSLVAILTFAVGIGVNTAVFNVVNGVLLRPLPYPDADRITLLWMDNRRQGIKEDITSYPNYMDWRSQSTSYTHMAAFRPLAFSLTGAGDPERLQGASVTANFFDVMGVPPLMGRLFTAENETRGQGRVRAHLARLVAAGGLPARRMSLAARWRWPDGRTKSSASCRRRCSGQRARSSGRRWPRPSKRVKRAATSGCRSSAG